MGRLLRFEVGPAPLLALVLTVLPVLLVGLASSWFAVEVRIFTQDATALAKVHPLAGVLSSLGILLWWTSASIWFFCATLPHPALTPPLARFCLNSALLSAYLALDDLFQIHESLAPDYLGIPEMAVYALLALAVASYLLIYRHQWLNRRGLLLLGALGLLAASVVADGVERWLWRMGHWTYLLEDGLKWMGIVAWMSFCVAWCRHTLGRRP
jgi:hypothetical protein